jgi:beta-glucanase (GH16 family)
MEKLHLKNRAKYLASYFILLTFSSCMYPQSNLIVDHSFENESASWVLTSGASRVTSNVNSGSYALGAVDNSSANQTITGLTPNTTYLLTGWLKSSSNSAVSLGVKWYGGNEMVMQTTSSTYTQLSIKFTTGPASTTANIYAYNPNGGSNMMFADNLTLIFTSETPYKLVWSDEFNGTGAVDPANWSFENGFVRNEEQQWYQPDNAVQKDGYLVFEARKENPIYTRLNPNFIAGSTDWKKGRQYINYTSSSINTAGKQSWLYGRFEIRAKIRNQNGTWPAIWTLGNSCEWPSNGEVDIMENYGGNVLANFAWGTNTRWTAKWDSYRKSMPSLLTKDPDWLSKFHIWTLDWDENRMSIYLDGELLNEIDLNTTINGTAVCSGQNPFKKPQYLLLNLALISNPTIVSNLPFPSQYIIDYARVYQLDTSLAIHKLKKRIL